jgi:phosphoribosyl-dephospho-CoA transferase
VTPLHRHQLVHLSDAGWQDVLARPWDETAAECLQHWAGARLPLVITRQVSGHGGVRESELALGLAAPVCWQRRRIALSVRPADVAWFDEFPLADRLAAALPAAAREAWRQLCGSLAKAGATARVYGSHGWQLVSGLPCVRAGSDVDLWLAVPDAAQADAAVAVLDGFGAERAPRLDGELVFPDGRAVAWREWQHWRAGRCRSVLAKSLQGPALLQAWPATTGCAQIEAVPA